MESISCSEGCQASGSELAVTLAWNLYGQNKRFCDTLYTVGPCALPLGLKHLQANALGIRTREKIPVVALGAPSLPLLYQKDHCRDLSGPCNATELYLLVSQSVFHFGGVRCSFHESLAFLKIGPRVGSASGWRPEIDVLEGALGF